MAEPSPSNPFFAASPAQDRFLSAVFSGQYRILGYGGGIRSGKTALILILLQLLCKVYPGSRWAIVRKDLPTIRRNVLPTFEKFRIRGFMGPVNYANWTATATNGSQIIFFTESLSEDPELNRWRGLEVNGFAPDEANELAEVSFRKAIERAGSWVVPGLAVQPPPLIVCTFNPSGGWVKRVFYDPWKAGSLAAPYYFQQATIKDNPHLPPEYLESLKSLPERDYKRFVEGDWSFVSGAFFDELGANTHLVPTPALQPYWTYWASYDWGYRHPAVMMTFAKDTDGQRYLLDTIRMHRMDDASQAVLCAERMQPQCQRLVFAGHDAFSKRMARQAALESTADVFAREGILMTHANIQRIQGWSAVRRGLTVKQPDGTNGVPSLLICDTPGNRWAIERMLEATPDPTNPDDVLKVDANEDGEGGDDALDCLRYGLASTGDARAPAGLGPSKEPDRALRFDLEKGRFIEPEDPKALLAKLLAPTGRPVTHRMPRQPRTPTR